MSPRPRQRYRRALLSAGAGYAPTGGERRHSGVYKPSSVARVPGRRDATADVLGASPPEVAAEGAAALEAKFSVAEDGPEVTTCLLEIIVRYGVRGRQIHDAN